MAAPDPGQREPASTPPPDGAVAPDPVRREPPSPRPQGRGGRTPPGAWLLGVFLLCVAGPSMLTHSFFPARWALAMDAHQWRWLLLAGGVALGLLAVQAIALDTGGGRAGKIKAIGGGLRSRFLPRCLVLLLAGPAVGGGVASDPAASRLDACIEAAEPSVGAFYRNHDGARLAGRTARLVLPRERESTRVEADRAALQRVAGVLPAAWAAPATTTPGVPGDDTSPADPQLALPGGPGGVGEPLPSAILLDRDLGAMDPERWGEVLDRLCDQGGVERLASPVRERASQRLADIFGLSLRESLEHAWKAGDKATASIASVRRPSIQDTRSQADEHLATAALWRASGVGWTDDHGARDQMALGDRRRFDDDPGGAVPFYEAALATGPGDPEATIRLALALFEGRAAGHGERPRRAMELLDGLRARGEALDRAWFAAAMNNLANLSSDPGRDAEALGTIDSVIEIAHRHGGPDHPLFATFYSNRATILRKRRRLDEAIVAIDRAIGIGFLDSEPDHPNPASPHSNRATILAKLGETDRAVGALRAAAGIWERHEHTRPMALGAHEYIERILREAGR